jgi:hypothetical protein
VFADPHPLAPSPAPAGEGAAVCPTRQSGFAGVEVAYSDINDCKKAEIALSRELRYAEALGHCSRILLVAGSDAPSWEPAVEQALRTLREAVGCTRLGLNLFLGREGGFQLPPRQVGDQDPQAPLEQPLPVDGDAIPAVVMERIRHGEMVGGALEALFPPPSTAYDHFVSNGLWSGIFAYRPSAT